MAGHGGDFMQRAEACRETFGGLSTTSRAQRHAWVQRAFLSRLTSPDLLPFLQERISGQDAALAQVAANLQRQVQTGSLCQPLRLGALGPSGTGKSETANLLAKWLDVPFVNLDAASMSDTHTAMAQTLGSGRGIVDSDQPGRLEQVAKLHNGCVLEISDLDHAVAGVGAALSDLFLQVLQTGFAQAAKGAMFDCTNVVLIFTLNLPDGKDERIFQPTGFAKAPSLESVRREAQRQLRKLFSAAFWGRVGEPVLFGPLPGDARETLLRRALERAAQTALERCGVKGVTVRTASGCAREILAGPGAPSNSFGARGLMELGEQRAAQAVLGYLRAGGQPRGELELINDTDGHTVLRDRS